MKSHQDRFNTLDGIRGFAALYIVFHHARLVCWESYEYGYKIHPLIYNAFDKICMYFFSLFKYGAEAVTLFFVLSGLVIHYKQAHAIQDLKKEFSFNLAGYLTNRVKRIYPPLVFSVLLMVALAFLSSILFHHPYPENLSLSTIFANLTFITTPFFSVAGNNYPLWSLRVEWWIYLVYPTLLLLNRKKIYVGYFLVVLVSVILYNLGFSKQYFWLETFLYLPTWCIGAYMADVLAGRIRFYKLFYVLIVFIPISFIEHNKFNNCIGDFIFGIGLLPFFLFLLSGKEHFLKLTISSFFGFFKQFSTFSYTLYIIHFPLQTFIVTIYKNLNNQQLPHNFYLAFTGILISILVSYWSHFYTEKIFVKKNVNHIIKKNE